MDEINVVKYIGKPYIPRVRDGSGYDCYSLVLAIEKDLGHNLPDMQYDTTSRAGRKNSVEIGKKEPYFEKLEKPLAGCIVILYYKDIPQHIGVYIGNGKVIHATADRGVVIDELRQLNVEGFYKIK